jgi:anti-anti-sigma factor
MGNMKYTTDTKGEWLIIRLIELHSDYADVSMLKDIILDFVLEGHSKVAVSFTSRHYVYSGELRVLIACYHIVQKHGGQLCVIEPDATIFEVLKMLNIDRVIPIYESDEKLLEL